MSRRRERPRVSGARWGWLALALALASLGACGGGESDDDKVGDTLRGYLAAVADRDGRRACGFLTREAQLRIFTTRRAHTGRDHPAESCASVVESFGPLYGTGRIRRVAVSGVAVADDRARARVDGFRVRLEKVRGDWKIAVAGLAQDVGDTPPRGRG